MYTPRRCSREGLLNPQNTENQSNRLWFLHELSIVDDALAHAVPLFRLHNQKRTPSTELPLVLPYERSLMRFWLRCHGLIHTNNRIVLLHPPKVQPPITDRRRLQVYEMPSISENKHAREKFEIDGRKGGRGLYIIEQRAHAKDCSVESITKKQ